MKIEKYTKADYAAIMDVWESSVKATHHFLKEDDFLFYKKIIPTDFLPKLEIYILEDNGLKAFIAVNESHLEMLFVKDDARGKGYGRKLIEYALHYLGVVQVDVNEQNEQAIGFYRKMGFEIRSMSATDGMGKDYPILHMCRTISNQMNKTFVVYGVSRGLGRAIAEHVVTDGDMLFGISRTEPQYFVGSDNRRWISADLSNPMVSAHKIKQVVGNQKIDCLIYNVGVWEEYAFSTAYDFEKESPEEIVKIVNTNITSCLLAVQSFIKNLKLSNNSKLIFIGSTWGLDNHNGKEVVFSATKFALRGMVHALRESLKASRIAVSILNLGYLATEYEFTDTQSVLNEREGDLIPLSDAINALRFILSTTFASCVKEINMPAMNDENI